MAQYVYRCQRYAEEGILPCPDTTERHKIATSPDHSFCPHCGELTKRIITVPQIITNPHGLRDENRFRPPGMSEKDYAAEQRADEAAYAKRWESMGGIPSKSEIEPVSLEQVIREQG